MSLFSKKKKGDACTTKMEGGKIEGWSDKLCACHLFLFTVWDMLSACYHGAQSILLTLEIPTKGLFEN